jgi:NADH-ubiquinone oxidoreductase chain 5
MTIIIAGISALGELDIKKIIALSTLSQLGLIFITIGLGLPLLAFFHLISHAYFKAILFICAGSVIHRIKDYQDTRLMGNGLKSLPVAFRIFTVANLRLCGIPFIRGFYSKDLILEVLIIRNGNIVIFLIALISTLLTLIYSIRVTQEIFFNSPKREVILSQVEIDVVILRGIIVLLIPSIVGGLGISWSTLSFLNIVFLPSWLKLRILGLIFISTIRLIKPIVKFSIPTFFHFMWFMPFIFRWAATQGGLKKRKQIWLYGERG